MSKDTHFGSKKQYRDVNIQQGKEINTSNAANILLFVTPLEWKYNGIRIMQLHTYLFYFLHYSHVELVNIIILFIISHFIARFVRESFVFKNRMELTKSLSSLG